MEKSVLGLVECNGGGAFISPSIINIKHIPTSHRKNLGLPFFLEGLRRLCLWLFPCVSSHGSKRHLSLKAFSKRHHQLSKSKFCFLPIGAALGRTREGERTHSNIEFQSKSKEQGPQITAVQHKDELIQVHFSTASALVLNTCWFVQLALHPLSKVRLKHSMRLCAYILPCFTLVSI